MKKIAQSVYGLLLVFILFFAFFNGSINYINKTVYTNNYSVHYVANTQKSDLDQIQEIDNYIGQNKDVSYYQVTHSNNQYQVFGELNQSLTKLPKFINKPVQQKSLISLADSGIDGNYYFTGDETSLEDFEQFVNENNLGTISYEFNDYYFSIQLEVLMLILISILLFLILFHSFIHLLTNKGLS